MDYTATKLHTITLLTLEEFADTAVTNFIAYRARKFGRGKMYLTFVSTDFQ